MPAESSEPAPGLPPNLLAQVAAARATYAPPAKVHNYYAPDSGLFAAGVITAWRQQNFRPIQITANGTTLKVASLRAKLHYGLRWLCDNASTAAEREFFVDMYDTARMRVQGNNVELYKDASLTARISLIADHSGPELQADLLAWLASDPPLRDPWFRPGVELDQETLLWFKDKIIELSTQGYCGFAKPTTIKIVRFPLNELVREYTPAERPVA